MYIDTEVSELKGNVTVTFIMKSVQCQGHSYIYIDTEVSELKGNVTVTFIMKYVQCQGHS